MAGLVEELDALPADTQAVLEKHRFNRERFLKLAEASQQGNVDNRVKGEVTAPAPGDVSDLPAPGTPEYERLTKLGREALERGELALCVLAGGMATRMGGVVKALVDALPGHSFLELRMAECRNAGGKGEAVPLWLMTSHATDAKIREILGEGKAPNVATFLQHLSVRLEKDARAVYPSTAEPDLHAPGHGDLPDALRESGLLERFVAGGGKAVLVANIDNLGAQVDPLVLGWHLDHGAPVTCEVVDKVGSDRGGIPVRHDGRPVVLEEFRLPEGFDASQVRVFNTNTFHFDAKALLDLKMDWTYFTVTKKKDDHEFLQFERLIGEITSHLDTRFLRVPRQGARSRFLPVKDNEELRARQPEIQAVLTEQGVLEGVGA